MRFHLIHVLVADNDMACRELARLPMIVVTGREDGLDECLEAGFDEIVLKPFGIEDLGAILSRFLPHFENAPSSQAYAH